MHEFSLAQGLHNQLIELARKHDATKIMRAEISIGKDAGIVVESFSFGVNVLVGQHDITKGMQVDIVEDDSADLILQKVELE